MNIRDIARALPSILDRPVAYHRAFADLPVPQGGGKVGRLGALGALVLSQMLYWTARTNDPDGWFWKTMEQWNAELGITRSELETARKRLRAMGVLQEARRGVPAKLYYRLDLVRLAELLFGTAAEGDQGEGNDDAGDDGPPPPSTTEQQDTGSGVSNQDCGNPANYNAGNLQTKKSKSGNLLNKEYIDYNIDYNKGAANAARASGPSGLEEGRQRSTRNDQGLSAQRIKVAQAFGLLPPEGIADDPYKARVLAALAGAAERARDPVQRLRAWFTDETWPLAEAFMRVAQRRPRTRKEAQGWLPPLQDMARAGASSTMIADVTARMLQSGLTVKSPYSVRNAVLSQAAAQDARKRAEAVRAEEARKQPVRGVGFSDWLEQQRTEVSQHDEADEFPY